MDNSFERLFKGTTQPENKHGKTAEGAGVFEVGDTDFLGMKLKAEDIQLIDQALNLNGLPENALDWARDIKDREEIKKTVDALQAYLWAPKDERKVKGKDFADVLKSIE